MELEMHDICDFTQILFLAVCQVGAQLKRSYNDNEFYLIAIKKKNLYFYIDNYRHCIIIPVGREIFF